MTAAEAPRITRSTSSRGLRLLNILALIWMFLVLFPFGLSKAIMDLDMFHEMALAREMFAIGHVPLVDSYAYTPTLSPVIHHEWGMGVLLYVVTMAAGMPGLYALLLILVVATVLISMATALKRGAARPLVVICGLLLGPLGLAGYGAVRAQFITLLFMAIQLYLLEVDRQGKRWWMWVWFGMFVLWVNMHGGFLVGLGILGIHWAETVLRTRRAQLRLLVVIAVSIALTGISPYGYGHLASVIRGAALARPFVNEWRPLWTDPIRMSALVISLLPLVYCLRRLGWKGMVGLPLFLVCAYLGLRHLRHLGLFAVVWSCYMPGWLTATRAGTRLQEFWIRRAALLRVVVAVLSILSLVPIIAGRQFCIEMPVRPAEISAVSAYYPVGPVRYLQAHKFSGNVMTPFHMGAYVSWKLWPRVKVSIDSRYEVAYDPAFAAKIVACYAGDPEWREVFAKYPPDLVMVPNAAKLAGELGKDADWKRIYVDDVYSLYAHPGAALPIEDHRGEPLLPLFP
jgi:hypothetical protein